MATAERILRKPLEISRPSTGNQVTPPHTYTRGFTAHYMRYGLYDLLYQLCLCSRSKGFYGASSRIQNQTDLPLNTSHLSATSMAFPKTGSDQPEF